MTINESQKIPYSLHLRRFPDGFPFRTENCSEQCCSSSKVDAEHLNVRVCVCVGEGGFAYSAADLQWSHPDCTSCVLILQFWVIVVHYLK